MPLTAKGRKILRSMKKRYGARRGASVFYASRNSGTIDHVEKARLDPRVLRGMLALEQAAYAHFSALAPHERHAYLRAHPYSRFGG